MITNFLFRLKMFGLHLLLWKRGLHVCITDYAATPDDVYRFRKKVYVEEGYFAEGIIVPDVWKDEYDTRSMHIYIKKHHEIVAATRLVLGKPFPLQLYFNVMLPDRAYGEFSRLAIDKKYRGGGKGIVLALAYGIIKTSRALNMPDWIMFMPERFKLSLEKLGLRFIELPQLPLEEHHRKAQEMLPGYFKNDVRPYSTDIHTLIHGFVQKS